MTSFLSSHSTNNTPIHRSLTNTHAAMARLVLRQNVFLTIAVIGTTFFSLASSSIVKGAAPQDRNYLWKEVVEPCVTNPSDRQHCGNVYVSLGAQFDNNGYLVTLGAPGDHDKTLPSRKIPGIECNTPQPPNECNKASQPLYNYWNDAWQYLEQHYPDAVRSGKVGLAIDSEPTRDQDQLHIHMSCLDDTVYDQLERYSKDSKISLTWSKLRLGPHGQERDWYAIRVRDINNHNPFSVITTNHLVNEKNMADQNIVVTESQNPHGEFFILNSTESSGETFITSDAHCFK